MHTNRKVTALFCLEPDLLDKDTKQRLGEEAISTACAGFHRQASPNFRQDVLAHLYGSNTTLYLAVDSRDSMIAFRAIQKFPEERAVVLAGAVKHPEGPKHLVRIMTQRILHHSDYRYVLTRTQNDHVTDMMRQLCPGGVVPFSQPVEDKYLELIQKTGLNHPNLDPATLHIPGYYGGQPMIARGPRPRSRDRQVREFMDQIDYQAGDAYLLIGLRNSKS